MEMSTEKKGTRILFVGDIMGKPGMAVFQKYVSKLIADYQLDAVIVNGENSSKNGKGLVPKMVDFFKHNGANVVTTGNHVWDRKELISALETRNDIIRPANYPSGCPGKGYTLFTAGNDTVAIINMHGRVFMRDPLDCPFRVAESLLSFLQTKTKLIFIDFHAEATSEKKAFAFFLDGKVTGIVGTHTHVQTADEQILPQGTAYMTDLGLCGPLHSVIGMLPEQVIPRFLMHPSMGSFVVQTKGPVTFCGAIIEADRFTGKALAIKRLYIVDDAIQEHIENPDLPS